MKKLNTENIRNEAGFSLVELMIAIAISGFVMGSVYLNYYVQKRTQVNQTQVAAMQQNIRAGMLIMTRALREAGSDPRFTSGAGFGFASTARVQLTRDIAGHPVKPNEGDGDVDDPGENVTFGFNPLEDTGADPDGIPDTNPAGAAAPNLAASLCISNFGGAFVPIADNIERLEFVYLDSNGNAIATPITTGTNLNRISAVQVSLLARASLQNPDQKHLNTSVYTSAAGTVWGPFNDGYRRRLSVATIYCRNRR